MRTFSLSARLDPASLGALTRSRTLSRPFAQQFPVSAARDEPFPPRASPTSLTAHASLDLDGTLMAASTRRDSLVSSFSLVSELSALFDGGDGRGRRWSVATSASSVEVGSQSTSGASGSGV